MKRTNWGLRFGLGLVGTEEMDPSSSLKSSPDNPPDDPCLHSLFTTNKYGHVRGITLNP